MVKKKREKVLGDPMKKNLKLYFAVVLHISTGNSKTKFFTNILMLELLIYHISVRLDS